MKSYFTFLFLSFVTLNFGQINNKLPLDLNTVYITIDLDSYSKLFENSFVKDTLFICKSSSTSTDKEDYTGKYFIGNAATLEFFAPMNTTINGDTFGDVGIEFKTRKIDQLQLFENQKTKVDTTFFQTDNHKIAWYKKLCFNLPAPHLEISLLEYQKEYLTYLGFSEKEITTSMTYDQFNFLLSGEKKYPRKFNTIKAIELEINDHEINYLKESIQNLGGTVKGNQLEINGITITYHITKKEQFRVKKIIIDLTDIVPAKTVKITEHIIINTKDKSAEIKFLY